MNRQICSLALIIGYCDPCIPPTSTQRIKYNPYSAVCYQSLFSLCAPGDIRNDYGNDVSTLITNSAFPYCFASSNLDPLFPYEFHVLCDKNL